MPTYLYYTQGILDFQEETATYSEERLEIRLKRKKHQCPKCNSKDVTLRILYERDVRGLPMGRIREVHFYDLLTIPTQNRGQNGKKHHQPKQREQQGKKQGKSS